MKLAMKVAGIFDRIIDVAAVLGAAIIIGQMLIVCLEVVMRYFLGRPQIWVVETTEYLLVWFTFLGATWILRREGHVKVDIVVNRLNLRIQALLGIISSIIGVVLCVLLVLYGTHVILDQLKRGLYFPTLLQVPKAPLYAIIPIGSSLLFIQFLRRGYGYLSRWKEPLNKEQEA